MRSTRGGTWKKASRTLVTALVTITIVGCKKAPHQEQGDPWKTYETVANYAAQRGKVVYQVKYQPETVVFDQKSTERAFKTLGSDGSTFTLNGAEPAVRQLKPGSVLFLYGVALRRVTGVATQGSDVVVTTTQADLTDAIQDGHIQWEVPVDFTVGTAMATPPQKTTWLDDLLIRPVWAAEPGQTGSAGSVSTIPEPGVTYEGSFLDWDYELSYAPAGAHRMNIKIEVNTTKLGGARAELKGEGYIEGLSSTGEILIHAGKLIGANFGTSAPVQGKVDFVWLAQQNEKPTFNREVKLKIPGAGWEYPVVIGGLPYILELSAAIIVHPAFTSKGAFTTGGFTVTYNEKEGLRSSPAGTAAEGEGQATEEVRHETSIFGLAASSFVAALELPRVELALGIMSPFDRLDVKSAPNWVGALNPGVDTKYLKIKTMAKTIEELALPVKPFVFFDIVTSAGTFTSGETGTMPGLSMLVPCQRAQIVVSGNAGVGAKIGFDMHEIKKGLSAGLASLVPHTATVEPFEASVPIFKGEMKTEYKNGIKCLGDVQE
jgi:hypothetical protein